MASRDRADIEKALLRKGFARSGKKRDHDYYFFEHRGVATSVFTKISRGSSFKEYGANLLARMAHQLNLSAPQLLRLIDCPMSAKDYVQLLRQKGVFDAE